jgi:hypothetical protein
MLDQLKENLRYMLTTKISIQDLNDIVKYTEQIIDSGGEVIIYARKGKITNIKPCINHCRNIIEGESENDE